MTARDARDCRGTVHCGKFSCKFKQSFGRSLRSLVDGPEPHSREERSGSRTSDRLDSWKEIAAYLKRDQRTVRHVCARRTTKSIRDETRLLEYAPEVEFAVSVQSCGSSASGAPSAWSCGVVH